MFLVTHLPHGTYFMVLELDGCLGGSLDGHRQVAGPCLAGVDIECVDRVRLTPDHSRPRGTDLVGASLPERADGEWQGRAVDVVVFVHYGQLVGSLDMGFKSEEKTFPKRGRWLPDEIELVAHVPHLDVFGLSLGVHDTGGDIHGRGVIQLEVDVALVVRKTYTSL